MLYRFLFILLGPLGKGPQYHEIGRSIATLMTDEVRFDHDIITLQKFSLYTVYICKFLNFWLCVPPQWI